MRTAVETRRLSSPSSDASDSCVYPAPLRFSGQPSLLGQAVSTASTARSGRLDGAATVFISQPSGSIVTSGNEQSPYKSRG
jgi:hypothetical protein